MSKVLIFGTEQTAELAQFYLDTDSKYEVAGFILSGSHLKVDTFNGLPVYQFEILNKLISASEYKLFAPMMPSEVNKIRQSIFEQGKQLGFEFVSYVSSKATVLTTDIGENCFILENNVIQPFVTIGDNTMIWSGNHIGHHSKVGHSVFITSHCVVSGNCYIKDFSYLGVNCAIVDNCIIEKGCMITMGSVLTTRKTVEGRVYSGNPARMHPKLTSKSLLASRTSK